MTGTERFTDRSRRVLSLACQAAERLHYQNIDTEHLLLGLMDDETDVAGQALRKLGLSSEKLEALIKKLAPTDKDFDPTTVELSAEVQTALEHAVKEGRRLGENSIGTEYLLLGLVQFENRAMAILEFAGAAPEQVRRQIRQVLIESGTPSPLIKDD